MISYAQNYEDVILDRIFGKQQKGIYVDVGANDPIENNLTYHFYKKGWKGINFEPSQTYFQKLQKIRPNDLNIDLGCSNKEEVLEFKEIVNTGLSTFSNEFDDLIKDLDYKVIKHQIKCIPIKKMFEEQKTTTIDFMSVDVEGFELNVLEGNDWEKYRPKVIVLEAVAPNRQDIITYNSFKPFLENVGYEMRYFDGLNVFFSDSKNTTIPDECFYPPNCFDDFQKHSTEEEIRNYISTIDQLNKKIILESQLYVESKLSKSAKEKLLKLRTKDLFKILIKRIFRKFY